LFYVVFVKPWRHKTYIFLKTWVKKDQTFRKGIRYVDWTLVLLFQVV
jgi:hypothetical protein